MEEDYYLHYYNCVICGKRISELEAVEEAEDRKIHYCMKHYKK
jgi:hypothetical protein